MPGWNRLRKDRIAILSIWFLALVTLAGLFAPVLAPHDPTDTNILQKYAGVSLTYPLGTDQLGRCVLSRLLYGIRTTMLAAVLTMCITMLIGTILGLMAGFFRGKVDGALMRICDVMLSFPAEVMILAVLGIMGPGLFNIILANVLAKWAWYTRMIRSSVLQYTNEPSVQFAKVSGGSPFYILRKHLFPRISGEIAVFATLDAGWVILNISALSFLGLGVSAPTPEWGMMLNEAKNVMVTHPAHMLPPGLAILFVVMALNFLGDSLQQVMNPAMHLTNKKGGDGLPFIEIKNLSVHDPIQQKDLVANITFTLHRQRCLGVIGESGSGKSTVAKALIGLIPPSLEMIGTILFDGEKLTSQTSQQWRGKRIGYIPQDAMNAFNPIETIGHQILETFQRHLGLRGKEGTAHAITGLERVHLNNSHMLMKKYPHELSGGMLQRVMIAITIMLSPDVIIADEPTASLDAYNRREVITQLQTLKEETGAALIIISHDLGVVQAIADELLVMHQGEMLEHRHAKEIFTSPEHPQTRHLLETRLRLSAPLEALRQQKRVRAFPC
ncbi:ATP-binding cassette domain-containing protein [Bacillus altitudinis]|nr:nickel/cobalt ABC transporter permease [Bacillus altitudinis]MBS4748794.1 ATP-binding cassette domain-containing protein [Bacillus altitudinis]